DRLGSGTCGSSNDFNSSNTLNFNSSASTAISSSVNPVPGGTYLPGAGANGSAGSLANLNGVSVNGNWTLAVTDGTLADIGTLASFSITFAGGALPVELTYFKAFPDKNEVILKWTTASETNNRGFGIERSRDGKDWLEMGFVEGAGTVQEERQYVFSDAKPFPGINYYRLHQVDFDGAEKYSPVVAAELETTGADLQVFPNPVVNRQAHFYFTEKEDQPYVLKIFDLSGQLCLKKAVSSNQAEIDLSGFQPAVYWVALENHEQRVWQKMVLAK
ncbi:MAG: T9SS type A sorting domain-containing protein, partial [Bacteroidota bacterium]